MSDLTIYSFAARPGIEPLSASTSKGNGRLTRDEAVSSDAFQDSAVISPEARQKLQGAASEPQPDGQELSDEQKKEVDKLKERDAVVRQHEQAHMMAGGSIVRGGPTYQMQTGPDGKQYAIGGEVNIDTSPVDGDPKATIRKAQQIQKAAAAPAEPSGQDRAVAAEAAAMEAKARQELSKPNNAGTGSTRSVSA